MSMMMFHAITFFVMAIVAGAFLFLGLDDIVGTRNAVALALSLYFSLMAICLAFAANIRDDK